MARTLLTKCSIFSCLLYFFAFIHAYDSNYSPDVYVCFLCYSHEGLEFSVLAQRVLAEVPDQVLNYMELHHIKPNKIEA